MTTALLDVQAQWAYSEILDGTNPGWYDNVPGIDSLRDKRRAQTPFDHLSNDERYNLAIQVSIIRKNLFFYFTGIQTFETVQLNRGALGRMFVPPNVWDAPGNRFFEFSHYVTTPTNDPKDPRAAFIEPSNYRDPLEPVVVARWYEHLTMIDGYHRAVLFWKYGPSDATIPAYIPLGMRPTHAA
jgi:hypothetical protein